MQTEPGIFSGELKTVEAGYNWILKGEPKISGVQWRDKPIKKLMICFEEGLGKWNKK